jgi:hypothetical protein
MKKLLLLTIGVMTAVSAASAIPIFASVGYLGGSGSNVTYKWNNTSGLQTGTGASATSIPVSFQYSDPNLPAPLQGPLNAHMTITAGHTGNVMSGAGFLSQPLAGTVTITLDTPYLGQNMLLSANFSGHLSGPQGGTIAIQDSETILADTVVFSSDFLSPSFFSLMPKGMSFTFLSVNPTLNVTGNYLRTFTASGSGQFFSQVPEPSGLILAGVGCALLLIGGIRRKVQS